MYDIKSVLLSAGQADIFRPIRYFCTGFQGILQQIADNNADIIHIAGPGGRTGEVRLKGNALPDGGFLPVVEYNVRNRISGMDCQFKQIHTFVDAGNVFFHVLIAAVLCQASDVGEMVLHLVLHSADAVIKLLYVFHPPLHG